MWPETDPADIADRWRPLTPAEETVAATLIKDAEAELIEQLSLRGLTAPPTFDTVPESERWERRFISTVADMVRRSITGDPDGWTTVTERLDDWSETKTRDASVQSWTVFVDDDAVDKLIPNRRRRRGAFSVRLGQT